MGPLLAPLGEAIAANGVAIAANGAAIAANTAEITALAEARRNDQKRRRNSQAAATDNLQVLRKEIVGGAQAIGAQAPVLGPAGVAAGVFPQTKAVLNSMTVAQLDALSAFYHTTFDLPLPAAPGNLGVPNNNGTATVGEKRLAVLQWLMDA